MRFPAHRRHRSPPKRERFSPAADQSSFHGTGDSPGRFPVINVIDAPHGCKVPRPGRRVFYAARGQTGPIVLVETIVSSQFVIGTPGIFIGPMSRYAMGGREAKGRFTCPPRGRAPNSSPIAAQHHRPKHDDFNRQAKHARASPVADDLA